MPSPAWPELEQLIAGSAGAVAIPCRREQGERVLVALQVTAASALGALALNSGGVSAGDGWFKLLGAGGSGLPSLAEANGIGGANEWPATRGALVVAYDAVGGVFAIDGGGLGIAPGEVCYLGPDTLAWQGLGGGHSAFVAAALNGALADVFTDLRWEGCGDVVAALAPGEAVFAYPPPFSAEGRDAARVTRSVVPLSEAVAFYAEAAAQLS